MSIIQTIRETQCSIIQSHEQEAAVIKENPNQKLLVRTGMGRFITTARDVRHFVDIIKKEGSDYVRDVSIYSK